MSGQRIDPAEGFRRTTYVVSGHPRSGTSMMMHALSRGGLEAAHDPSLDTMAADRRGYVQNPGGFYELAPAQQRHPWYPLPFWGKLIKSQYKQLVGLAPGRYRVVFMMRDPEEIRMSYRALGEATARQPLDWDGPEDYRTLMKRFVAAASMRLDMEVLEVWYSAVIADPRAELERIREFGFPIDVERAAGAVDPALHRHRAVAKDRRVATS